MKSLQKRSCTKEANIKAATTSKKRAIIRAGFRLIECGKDAMVDYTMLSGAIWHTFFVSVCECKRSAIFIHGTDLHSFQELNGTKAADNDCINFLLNHSLTAIIRLP